MAYPQVRFIVPEPPKYEASLDLLVYRTRDFFAHLCGNKATLAARGKRLYAGKLISTASTESAVNPVINARMCKCRLVQWTSRGAYPLAQARYEAINGALGAKSNAYKATEVEKISPKRHSASISRIGRPHELPRLLAVSVLSLLV